MTDINKEYEKEYYDEYRNNYYNPDDDDGEPGINLNWKRIQKGFHSVAGDNQETEETLSGMQVNLETLNTDVETLKTDVDDIKESIDDLNTAVETAEQAAEAAAASEAAAETAQAAIEEIADSIPDDYSNLSAQVENLLAEKGGNVYYSTTDNEYVALTGSFAHTNGWSRSGYIDCSKWDKIVIKSVASSEYNCFYDANKSKVKTFWVREGINSIDIPSDAQYFAISNASALLTNEEIFSQIKIDLNSIDAQLSGCIELFLISETYIDSDGNQSGYAGWSSTDFVEIDDDVSRIIILSTRMSTYNCFYDIDKTKIKRFTVSDGVNNITIPESAKYFRLSNTTLHMEATTVYSYLRTKILDEAGDIASGFSGDVITLNPGMKAEMLQAETGYLVLLHLSDIHINVNSLGNLRDVVKFFSKYNALIDGAVCTGDMQTQKFSDTYYDTVWDVNGGGKIMTCIGNHDCTEGGDNYGRVEHTQAEVFDKFIKPYVTGQNPLWGEVNYQTDITYWYKDYADKHTRLISMNSMLTDSEATAQNTWLRGVLSDAKTNNYSVIIMTHYGPYNGVKIECNFTDIDNPVISGFNSIYQQSVQDFIDGGGDFVCYLSGHTHYDLICKNSNFPEQLFVVVTSTHGAYAEDTKPYNRFNVITFDKTNHVVKIMRVGGDRNKYMRHIGLITIDYKTLNVIYSE